MRTLVAWNFVVLLLLAAQGHAFQYIILPASVRSVISRRSGCLGKVRCCLRRILKRFKETELVLHVTNDECHLTYENDNWQCSAQGAGAGGEAVMFVVKDKRLGSLMGLTKKAPTQGGRLTTVLKIYAANDASSKGFVVTKTDGTLDHQVKLSANRVVMGPINDADTVIVPIFTTPAGAGAPLSLGQFLFPMMPPPRATVAKLSVDDTGSLTATTQVTIDKIAKPAIAVRLVIQKFGVRAKLSFVDTGKAFPSHTVAVIVAGEGRKLSKRFMRARATLQSANDNSVLTSLDLKPTWAVLARQTPTDIEVPKERITTIAYEYNGETYNGLSPKEMFDEVKTFGRSVTVYLLASIEHFAAAREHEYEAHMFSSIFLTAKCSSTDVVDLMVSIAKAGGVTPEQVLYRGSNPKVKKLGFATYAK